MSPVSDIDVLENTLRQKGDLLDILLIDRTTKRNIIWATDSYVQYGKDFLPNKQIKAEFVTGVYGKLIQPRAAKSREEQRQRTKDKAEVFTPLEAVDQMNKAVDWAGSNYPATKETWQDYVRELRLEISCGEAPFIVSRYNPTAHTQKIKVVKKRVGFLDRKLHVVSEYCHTKEEWLHWAREAYKASYGYEWQGDNVLIARENLLETLKDHYKDKFATNRAPSLAIQREFAEIISWNIFQMDGIKYVIPMSCRQTVQSGTEVPKNQLAFSLLERPKKILVECEGCRTGNSLNHSGKYVKIMDWNSDKLVQFIDLAWGNLKD